MRHIIDYIVLAALVGLVGCTPGINPLVDGTFGTITGGSDLVGDNAVTASPSGTASTNLNDQDFSRINGSVSGTGDYQLYDLGSAPPPPPPPPPGGRGVDGFHAEVNCLAQFFHCGSIRHRPGSADAQPDHHQSGHAAHHPGRHLACLSGCDAVIRLEWRRFSVRSGSPIRDLRSLALAASRLSEFCWWR